MPLVVKTTDEACKTIIAIHKDRLSLAAPLGLGKPNLLLNAIYAQAKANPRFQLDIFTALSLQPPNPGTGLKKKFLGPFNKRFFGPDYPALQYAIDATHDRLPENVRVREFYFQAGAAQNHQKLQQDYVSANYTHVPQVIFDHGINVLVQIISKNRRLGEPGASAKPYSLSCNPDLTPDVRDIFAAKKRPLYIVGVVHPALPFMRGDAEVEEGFFDLIVDGPETNHELFALPRQPIQNSDFMIGLWSSLLVEDGGSLQIGIGSLSDSLVYALILRQQNNDLYRKIVGPLLESSSELAANSHLGKFKHGLYGTSEMVMDGFMHLRKAGILIREVNDFDLNVKRYLHGSFFLGSKTFYNWLRELEELGEHGIGMSRVSKVNDLYDEHEFALRRQRVKARFFNTCMGMSLLGEAFSDTLDNGQVISGVGGQYNFVAMAKELSGARSALLFRSTRHIRRGKHASNIVWGSQHSTIPRHLRDVAVTEYGVAFLQGKTDGEVIASLIQLADRSFQHELTKESQGYKKLPSTWSPPKYTERNTGKWVADFLGPYKKLGLFPDYPFGSDFTPVEQRLTKALETLNSVSADKLKMISFLSKGFLQELRAPSNLFHDELERMELKKPSSFEERLLKTLLVGALTEQLNKNAQINDGL